MINFGTLTFSYDKVCTGFKIVPREVFHIPLTTELSADPGNGWLGVTVLNVASVTWLLRLVLVVMYDVFATSVVDLLVVESLEARVRIVVTLDGINVWEIPTVDVSTGESVSVGRIAVWAEITFALMMVSVLEMEVDGDFPRVSVAWK